MEPKPPLQLVALLVPSPKRPGGWSIPMVEMSDGKPILMVSLGSEPKTQRLLDEAEAMVASSPEPVHVVRFEMSELVASIVAPLAACIPLRRPDMGVR